MRGTPTLAMAQGLCPEQVMGWPLGLTQTSTLSPGVSPGSAGWSSWCGWRRGARCLLLVRSAPRLCIQSLGAGSRQAGGAASGCMQNRRRLSVCGARAGPPCTAHLPIPHQQHPPQGLAPTLHPGSWSGGCDCSRSAARCCCGVAGQEALTPRGVWPCDSAAPCGQGLSLGHAASDREEGSLKHVSAAASPALHLDRLRKLLIACDII